MCRQGTKGLYCRAYISHGFSPLLISNSKDPISLGDLAFQCFDNLLLFSFQAQITKLTDGYRRHRIDINRYQSEWSCYLGGLYFTDPCYNGSTTYRRPYFRQSPIINYSTNYIYTSFKCTYGMYVLSKPYSIQSDPNLRSIINLWKCTHPFRFTLFERQ